MDINIDKSKEDLMNQNNVEKEKNLTTDEIEQQYLQLQTDYLRLFAEAQERQKKNPDAAPTLEQVENEMIKGLLK